MQSVMATPLAIFLHLETIGVVLLVLLGRVVTALALRTRQGDQRTHQNSSSLFVFQAFPVTHELMNGARCLSGLRFSSAKFAYL